MKKTIIWLIFGILLISIVGAESINFTIPTDNNNAYIERFWTYINLSLNLTNISSVKLNFSNTIYTLDEPSNILELHGGAEDNSRYNYSLAFLNGLIQTRGDNNVISDRFDVSPENITFVVVGVLYT